MANIVEDRSRSTDGVLIITDEKGFREMTTKSCPHCGGFFIIIPGSGKLRHYCQLCEAPTCDKGKCLVHSPVMRRIELIEAGKLPLKAL
jgi:hypothetical protein